MLLRTSVVTIICMVLLQVHVAPVVEAGPVAVKDFSAPGIPAEEVHEHLDVDPDVIGPVESPLKHLDQAKSDKKYVDFINDLYKKDKSKTPLTFEQKSRK